MPESLTQASIDAHSAIGRLVARRPRTILAASLAACALFIAPIARGGDADVGGAARPAAL